MSSPNSSSPGQEGHDEYYARTVVVPMGRPDTAADMLRIAGGLAHPKEGLVTALVISLGDAEQTNKISNQINDVIEAFRQTDAGHQVEVLTEIAASVSRGILDVARERNADVILLGVHRSTQRSVKLGTVVENVIAAAPCSVLIYRSAESTAFQRVVVPVDGTLPSAMAMKLGVSFALQHGIPLRQMSIQFDYHYDPEHEEAIKRTASQLPGKQNLPKKLIRGRQPGREIVNEMTAADLLVMGFAQKTDLERHIINDLSNQLLNQAPGPVILISQHEWHRGIRGSIEHGIARLNPQLTLVEQNELIWSAEKSAGANLDYIVMIVLSAALATLGLLTNSVAVIIGAMLVAPLMSPISGFSTGMATGILRLTRRASLTLFSGVTLALLISIVMGVLLPIDSPTDEMLARGSPNLLDAAIALVSGWVAAYATARKGIPAALAGVAIAAALMPPISTVGLGIALRDMDLAIGANLLFLANIAFIIAAQYSTFLWMGMRPTEEREGVTLNRSRAWWIVLFLITLVVLVVFARLGSQAIDEAHIRERLEAEAFHGAQVVDYQVISSVPLSVQFSVQSDHQITPEEVEAAQMLINDLYRQAVHLTVVARQVVRPLDPVMAAVRKELRAVFPRAQFADLWIEEGDGIVLHAILQDFEAPTRNQLEQARRRVSQVVDADARLEVVYQQKLAVGLPAAITDGGA
ncbi:MAG: TIGR00341 family protein [Chloroflexota bacterium]|nr:TIGR00341 family protein [Chloroflexota bacterium]MDE2946793.1 TIGR00341 family protein [Chloroflexota bacterium]